jgi:two-component system, NtrC family, nitrogen regulation sensor histidine kinase GlnL
MINSGVIHMTSSHDYRQLLDNLTNAVVLLDSSLAVVYANTAAESLLEVSSQQMINRPFNHYFYESEKAIEKIREVLVDGNEYTKRKALWRLHPHQQITVDYTVTPIANKQQILLEIQPLDRLLRISREEALLASQETTKNLVRGVAHEVKNPLGGIRGAAQLLSQELDTDELKEYTSIIIAETDRLRNLVDRMLGPLQTISNEPVNIHQVLEHVLAIICAEVGDKISFSRHYDPSIPEFVGDSDMLIQATLNILRNSVQALLEHPSNTSPTIAVHSLVHRQFTIGRKHYPLVANIRIEDNGPGIPSDIIDDIFYPMISGRAEGTGLGLAISQQLITQHKGIIECHCGNGKTTFSVYIPLTTASASPTFSTAISTKMPTTGLKK